MEPRPRRAPGFDVDVCFCTDADADSDSGMVARGVSESPLVVMLAVLIRPARDRKVEQLDVSKREAAGATPLLVDDAKQPLWKAPPTSGRQKHWRLDQEDGASNNTVNNHYPAHSKIAKLVRIRIVEAFGICINVMRTHMLQSNATQSPRSERLRCRRDIAEGWPFLSASAGVPCQTCLLLQLHLPCKWTFGGSCGLHLPKSPAPGSPVAATGCQWEAAAKRLFLFVIRIGSLSPSPAGPFSFSLLLHLALFRGGRPRPGGLFPRHSFSSSAFWVSDYHLHEPHLLFAPLPRPSSRLRRCSHAAIAVVYA